VAVVSSSSPSLGLFTRPFSLPKSPPLPSPSWAGAAGFPAVPVPGQGCPRHPLPAWDLTAAWPPRLWMPSLSHWFPVWQPMAWAHWYSGDMRSCSVWRS